MKNKNLTIWDWLLNPIKTWNEMQWRKYKKTFYTNRGFCESSKYHRQAKRI